MSLTVINNSDTGLVVRTALNAMFAELYAGVSTITARTANATAAVAEVTAVDATSGNITITAPAVTNGAAFMVIKTDASANTVTIGSIVLTRQNGCMVFRGISGAWVPQLAYQPTFVGSAPGLVPTSAGGTTNYLRADGSYAAPAGTTYSAFSSVAAGLVPASGGGTTNFLRADGSFAAPPGAGSVSWGGITGTLSAQSDLNTALAGKASTSAFSSVAAGLVPASGGGTSNFLRADGTFAAPAGGTTFSIPFVSGRFYRAAPVPLANGTASGFGVLKLGIIPIHPRTGNIDQLGCRLTTAGGAGVKGRLGIWDIDATTGLPTGLPLIQTDEMDFSAAAIVMGTVTAQSAGTLTVATPAGLGTRTKVYAGWICQNSTGALECLGLGLTPEIVSVRGGASAAAVSTSATASVLSLTTPFTYSTTATLPDLTSATFTESANTYTFVPFFRAA